MNKDSNENVLFEALKHKGPRIKEGVVLASPNLVGIKIVICLPSKMQVLYSSYQKHCEKVNLKKAC